MVLGIGYISCKEGDAGSNPVIRRETNVAQWQSTYRAVPLVPSTIFAKVPLEGLKEACTARHRGKVTTKEGSEETRARTLALTHDIYLRRIYGIR